MSALSRGLKAVLRPFVRPLQRRIEMPLRVMLPRLEVIEQAIANIDAAIGRLDAAHGGTVGRVQALEGASEHDRIILGALRQENQNLVRGWLRLRTDLLRLEQASAARWVRITPALLARLAGGGGGLVLHLGAERGRVEGAVNVSERAHPDADLVAPLSDLPFRAGSVDAITVGMAEEACAPADIAHWRTLLRAGGGLTFACVP